MKKLLNFEYGAINAIYWMYFGVITSFASIFLLSKDYMNSEIGIILAMSSILAVVVQMILADIADRSQKISPIGITEIITVILLVATLTLFLFTGKSIVLSIIFIFIGACLIALQPIINSMAFYISQSGCEINYGITRSAGSVFYAVICALLGYFVQVYGAKSIPIAGVLVLIWFLGILSITKKTYLKSISENSVLVNKALNDDIVRINTKDFIKNNAPFIIFSFGVMWVFFENAVINYYLMQIIMDVGGNSNQMGNLFFFMAILELPCFIFFSKLRKRFSCQLMLKIASIAFTAKILLVFMANSMALIYIGFLFQFFSYPIFMASAVYLVDEVMDKGEAVKGQALITGMITLSNIFASLAGGAILDVSGPHLLLFISTITCIVGTIIIYASVDRIKKSKKDSLIVNEAIMIK